MLVVVLSKGTTLTKTNVVVVHQNKLTYILVVVSFTKEIHVQNVHVSCRL